MPVTARFSSKFYERLGDDVAEELVNWFNSFDQDNSRRLTEMNELNWARFSDRLDSRVAELRTEFERKFLELDKRFVAVEVRFDTLEAGIDAKVGRLEAKMFRALFLFWAGTTIPLASLIIALSELFTR